MADREQTHGRVGSIGRADLSLQPAIRPPLIESPSPAGYRNAGLLPGTPGTVGLDPAGLEHAGKQTEALVTTVPLWAAGIAVARHGRLVFARCWGAARREPFTPATDDTLFAVASITKPLTATAIVALSDQGRLDLDAPVAALVPEFAVAGKSAITIRHILTHTSGIDDAFMPRDPAKTPGEHMERIFRLPLVQEPGARYAYCNAGYRLLGEVIAKVTGEPHERFFQSRLLDPMGMRQSFLRPHPNLLHSVAEVDRVPTGMLAGMCASGSTSGGLFSTVTDIVRLGQLFLDSGLAPGGRILSERSAVAMTRDHAVGALDSLGKPVEQGLGWMLRPRLRFSGRASAGAFAHPGATGCWLVVEPALDLVFGFVTSRWGWSGYGRRQVLDAVLASDAG